jgi:hypothetical protein
MIGELKVSPQVTLDTVLPPYVPPVTVPDFTNPTTWTRLYSPWYTTVATSTTVTLSTTGLFRDAGIGIWSGFLLNALIYPDVNGDIEFEIEATGLNIGINDAAGGGCGGGLICLSGMGKLRAVLVGKNVAVANPRILLMSNDGVENTTMAPSQIAIDRVAAVYGIRAQFNAGTDPNVGANFYTTSQSINLDGAGWIGSGGAWASTTWQHFELRGMQVVVGLGSASMYQGFTVTLQNFKINKGIVRRY